MTCGKTAMRRGLRSRAADNQGATSFAIPSSTATSVLQIVAVVLLAGHVLELLIAFGSVKRYSGPLVDSIALTLLFGFLHWGLLRKERSEQFQGQPG